MAASANFTSLKNLEITANPRLTSLEGLHQLTTVTGSLYVWQYCIDAECQNSVLADLRGLRGVTSVGMLVITGNPALPTCEAEWLRDNIGLGNIGTVRIENNDGLGTCAP